MALLHAADWHLTRLRDARLATPGAAPRACGCGILQTDGETPITVTLLFWGLGFKDERSFSRRRQASHGQSSGTTLKASMRAAS